MLTEAFLAPYYKRGDVFPNLLARAVYMSLYKRPEDTCWTDTIRRVVEGNCAIDSKVTYLEAEDLFHYFWTMQALPSGRGLWVGGVPGIPTDAAFNCYFSMIRGIDDWGWVANQLMLGGGVGVGLEKLRELPSIVKGQPTLYVVCSSTHPNISEVNPNPPTDRFPYRYIVPDSRTGWVNALKQVMTSAWSGESLYVDVGRVRPRGDALQTFGGTACGPGPLVAMLRSVWAIIRGAQGRRLTTLEGLDITNFIGVCVKSGNVRRSALLVLSAAHDEDIWRAKTEIGPIFSHRHTSNNSLNVQTDEQLRAIDWDRLVQSNVEFGDPGVNNLALGRKQDPLIEGVNPCGEIQLRNRESCNLAEVFPAMFQERTSPERVFQIVTRYTLRQRLLPFTDPTAERVRTETMRLGVGIGGLCDFPWTQATLRSYFQTVRQEADRYADELYVNRPIAVTTVKPSGSISLLNNSSPGLHAAEAPYYVRRMRVSDTSPMAEALSKANLEREVDMYDQSGHTYVYSFPIKAKPCAHVLQDETLKTQFERQFLVQTHWADNSVSSTIRFDRDETKELVHHLKEYAPFLKGLALLANTHKYPQAPYEAINQDQFQQMSAQIDNNSSLTGGKMMLEACERGACPIQ